MKDEMIIGKYEAAVYVLNNLIFTPVILEDTDLNTLYLGVFEKFNYRMLFSALREVRNNFSDVFVNDKGDSILVHYGMGFFRRYRTSSKSKEDDKIQPIFGIVINPFAIFYENKSGSEYKIDIRDFIDNNEKENFHRLLKKLENSRLAENKKPKGMYV